MKVQLPFLGHAAGSSAGTIYQTYRGRTYARSFPAVFHYPDTKKQQRCQASFFDIQRPWIPIYKQLSSTIGKMQRKNKNPFNTLSRMVYRIFNPYNDKKKTKIISDFGLDRLNRVRPAYHAFYLEVNGETVTLTFDMARPYVDLSVTLDTTHIIIFNITRQSMYYMKDKFKPDRNAFRFQNTLEWKPDDTLVTYCALSGIGWLGNFNLMTP